MYLKDAMACTVFTYCSLTCEMEGICGQDMCDDSRLHAAAGRGRLAQVLAAHPSFAAV